MTGARLIVAYPQPKDVQASDFAWSDGKTWIMIDYKTGRAEPRCRTQVQPYALALQRATGLPARAVLLALQSAKSPSANI